MKTLGIIPARSGSKEIRKKNTKPLAAKPLIEYTFDCARKSRLLDRVILSTDSPEIKNMAIKAKIEAPFLRPLEISGNRSPAVQYIEHALKHLLSAEKYIPEIIVILQPTAPFRIAEDVDACIRLLVESGADTVISVSKVPKHYHPGWQFSVGKKNELLTFIGGEISSLPVSRQDLGDTYTRNGAVYAFRREAFEKNNSIYGKSSIAYIMPPERSVNIDSIWDWLFAEAMLTGRHKT